MDDTRVYVLQNRWKLEGRYLQYYGLRNRERMFQNRVKLSVAQRTVIAALPKALDEREKKLLKKLLGDQIVCREQQRATPRRLEDARFCTICCANDFMIPGLEFDEQGRCPLCQTAEETASLKSVVPLIRTVPRAKKSRFDIAVFYTGGKDSTFLLYYLAKVQHLRVLALTWELPFMSDCARRSIEGAKRTLPNVEFIARYVSTADLQRVYRALYALSGNTCACPSLAYVLFYPELVANRVPYFVLGNEPVQMLGLYYNHIAPRIAYSFADNKLLAMLMNMGRVLTLHPPLKRGQWQTLLTMKQLAYGANPLQKLSGYTNELVGNVVKAIQTVPELLQPLKSSIRRSSWSGHIPAFVHFDFDEICQGTYDWDRVKDLLIRECGWVAPDVAKKALHTSCQIERCKDQTQFRRFYHCESTMIPFSALETALASRRCGRSREDMMLEMKHCLGFSLEDLPECAVMRWYVEDGTL